MDAEKLKELLNKIPILPVAIAISAYFAWDFYSFMNGPDSPLVMKVKEKQQAQVEVDKLKVRLNQVNEFVKTLDTKRMELRRLAQELEATKATLSENLDLPEFMKLVLTEAKKVGLTVTSLKPTASSAQEYYAEQVFDLSFRGIYVQLLVFLERLSKLQKIVRVDNFDMKLSGSNLARYVELEGLLQIKVYRYLGSKADELARAGARDAAAKAGAGR